MTAYRHASGDSADGECLACVEDERWGQHPIGTPWCRRPMLDPQYPAGPYEPTCATCGHAVELVGGEATA